MILPVTIRPASCRMFIDFRRTESYKEGLPPATDKECSGYGHDLTMPDSGGALVTFLKSAKRRMAGREVVCGPSWLLAQVGQLWGVAGPQRSTRRE
jgi:hypothetical protein